MDRKVSLRDIGMETFNPTFFLSSIFAYISFSVISIALLFFNYVAPVILALAFVSTPVLILTYLTSLCSFEDYFTNLFSNNLGNACPDISIGMSAARILGIILWVPPSATISIFYSLLMIENEVSLYTTFKTMALNLIFLPAHLLIFLNLSYPKINSFIDMIILIVSSIDYFFKLEFLSIFSLTVGVLKIMSSYVCKTGMTTIIINSLAVEKGWFMNYCRLLIKSDNWELVNCNCFSDSLQDNYVGPYLTTTKEKCLISKLKDSYEIGSTRVSFLKRDDNLEMIVNTVGRTEVRHDILNVDPVTFKLAGLLDYMEKSPKSAIIKDFNHNSRFQHNQSLEDIVLTLNGGLIGYNPEGHLIKSDCIRVYGHFESLQLTGVCNLKRSVADVILSYCSDFYHEGDRSNYLCLLFTSRCVLFKPVGTGNSKYKIFCSDLNHIMDAICGVKKYIKKCCVMKESVHCRKAIDNYFEENGHNKIAPRTKMVRRNKALRAYYSGRREEKSVKIEVPIDYTPSARIEKNTGELLNKLNFGLLKEYSWLEPPKKPVHIPETEKVIVGPPKLGFSESSYFIDDLKVYLSGVGFLNGKRRYNCRNFVDRAMGGDLEAVHNHIRMAEIKQNTGEREETVVDRSAVSMNSINLKQYVNALKKHEDSINNFAIPLKKIFDEIVEEAGSFFRGEEVAIKDVEDHRDENLPLYKSQEGVSKTFSFKQDKKILIDSKFLSRNEGVKNNIEWHIFKALIKKIKRRSCKRVKVLISKYTVKEISEAVFQKKKSGYITESNKLPLSVKSSVWKEWKMKAHLNIPKESNLYKFLWKLKFTDKVEYLGKQINEIQSLFSIN